MATNFYVVMCAMQGDSSDANLAATLESRSLGPQLQRLSFAFAKCLLCIEGSNAFQHKMAERSSQLYRIARHCGLTLQCFLSTAPSTTQVSRRHTISLISLTGRQTCGQTDRQTYRQTGTQPASRTARETDRQTACSA